MGTPVQIYISNQESFMASLQRARDTIGDLSGPLSLIANDFYKSEQAIFQLKGPGQYEDLNPKYKTRKQKQWGSVYPILKASGALMRSVTSRTDQNAICIITKSSLTIGTLVRSKDGAPYPAYLQQGTKRMPARPFLFIGPESSYANSDQAGRLTRWNNILNEWTLAALGAPGTGSSAS